MRRHWRPAPLLRCSLVHFLVGAIAPIRWASPEPSDLGGHRGRASEIGKKSRGRATGAEQINRQSLLILLSPVPESRRFQPESLQSLAHSSSLPGDPVKNGAMETFCASCTESRRSCKITTLPARNEVGESQRLDPWQGRSSVEARRQRGSARR